MPQSAEVPRQRSEAIGDVLAACRGCRRGGLLTLGYGLIHRNHVLYTQGRALKFCYKGPPAGTVVVLFRKRGCPAAHCDCHSPAVYRTCRPQAPPPFSSKIPSILAVGPVRVRVTPASGSSPRGASRRYGQTSGPDAAQNAGLADPAALCRPIRGLAVCPTPGPAGAPLTWPVRRSPPPRCVPRGGRSPRARRTTRPPEPPAGTPPPPA